MRRPATSHWIAAVCVAAVPASALPAAASAQATLGSLDDTPRRHSVVCDMPPALAALVDDSAAYMNATLADAEATLDAMQACADEHPRDGATRFRTGYLGHLFLARTADATGMSRNERLRRSRQAGEHMQLGLEYAPDSARFHWLRNSVSRYRLVRSRSSTLNAVWPPQHDRAQALAEAAGDSALLGRIHAERARWHARMYESRAHQAKVVRTNRRFQEPVVPGTPSAALWRFMVRGVETPNADRVADELTRLLEASERAVAYDPSYDMAWRLRYRALLIAGDTATLLATARMHATYDTVSALPSLALGYAQHRLGRDAEARDAFDVAIARLDAAERAAWFGPGPLLPDAAARALAAHPPVAMLRRADVLAAWGALLARSAANPARSELLARRVEAELRFGDAERGVPGIATDRGLALARFGPPDRIAVLPRITDYVGPFPGCSAFAETVPATGVNPTVSGLHWEPLALNVPCQWPAHSTLPTTIWGYEARGEAIRFVGAVQELLPFGESGTVARR